MGLLSKASKLAKVAKKVTDTKKSAVRKVFDELPESEKAELPSQPDDGSLIGYHGTAKERSADEPFFDIDFARKQDQFMGEGFYFTIDPNIASEYANMRAFKDFDIEGSDGKGGSLLRKRDSGVLTSTSKLLEGLDIDDNPIAMNQSISRFDLSGLEKPYVVKNNKDRLYLKDNIEKIKKQGYDSVLFAEFGDRSKQIMVFPEHMDKIDTTEMASIKRADVEMPPASRSQLTQRSNTINTYRKADRLLNEKVGEAKTLDYGAGLGLSKKEFGYDTFEPFPEANFIPTYSSPADISDNSYKRITNLNVLNVVPKNERDNIVKNIGRILTPDGKAIIVTRGTKDVEAAKVKVKAEDGWIIGTGSDARFQKGFDQKELEKYVQITLGKDFTVNKITGDKLGKAAVMVDKKVKLDAGGLLTTSLTPNRSTMSMNPILKHHYENIATDSAVRNEDGSLSTVKTAIVEIDGKETLIPTVWNGEILEGDRLNEAIDNAVNSGKKWPNIDAENVKAIERLNNLDKLLHQDMKPISREEAQKVLINEFSKKRTLNKDSLKPVFSTTSSEDVMLPENTNDAIDQPTEKGLLDKFKNSPLKYIKDLNLMGSDKRIELGNTIEFNKGGTPMIQKQMEMFEDGGLKDQGGTVDPMSGNDVPVGSTQKEVRDDIPAQLSEGEFVFPADVVRFIGLEKLMGLRQQAKMGLKKMEDMGQMGNSDEATMPDDMPFGMADLIVMSPEGRQVEMAEGGVVQAATGVNVTPSTRGSTTGVTRTNNVTPTSSNFLAPTTRPLVTGTSNTGPRPDVPTFEDSMGQASITLIQYQNAEGATLMVPHMGGKPIYAVPAGYYEVNADGTPVNPEDVPAAGAGDATTTQPVKPIEVRDGNDMAEVSSAINNANAALSMAELALGERKPTYLEKVFMDTKAYKNLKDLQKQAANIDTGDDNLDDISLAMNGLNVAYSQLPSESRLQGLPQNIQNDFAKTKADLTKSLTKVGYTQYAQSRGLAGDTNLSQDESGSIAKSVVPSSRSYDTTTEDTPVSNVIADQTRMQRGQIGGLPPASTSVPSVETKPVVPSADKYNYNIPSVETPSIDTQKMLDAYKDYNPYSTVPELTNFSDPMVITPPKVEDNLEKLNNNLNVPIISATNIDKIAEPTFNELTSNSVDQPGFGIDSTTSFEPPQASLETYNTANQDLGYLERFNIFDSDTRAKADADREMKAAEKSRAKAAEEFAREEKARAAAELTAAQKQLATLQAEEERSKPDAPEVSIGGPVGSSPRSSPSQSPRGGGVPDRDGPDGNGGGGGGSGGGGGGGNSGGSAGGGGGPYNKGGLAAKKTKKKPTKRYKKGGLAASKK